MSGKDWPAWRYDPVAMAGQIFESPDEVPDGWVARLPEPGDETVPAFAHGSAAMTRAEIVDALRAGGIMFQRNAKTDDLDALLRGKLTDVLTARDTECDADAPTRDLLSLLG